MTVKVNGRNVGTYDAAKLLMELAARHVPVSIEPRCSETVVFRVPRILLNRFVFHLWR